MKKIRGPLIAFAAVLRESFGPMPTKQTALARIKVSLVVYGATLILVTAMLTLVALLSGCTVEAQIDSRPAADAPRTVGNSGYRTVAGDLHAVARRPSSERGSE